MASINVYEQYFEAKGTFNGVERHGALVILLSDSEAGNIRYEACVTFFPHRDEEDYAVSYDACFSKVLYEGTGRRSKKKEAAYLEGFREMIDEIAKENDAEVYWEKPLREARFG